MCFSHISFARVGTVFPRNLAAATNFFTMQIPAASNRGRRLIKGGINNSQALPAVASISTTRLPSLVNQASSLPPLILFFLLGSFSKSLFFCRHSRTLRSSTLCFLPAALLPNFSASSTTFNLNAASYDLFFCMLNNQGATCCITSISSRGVYWRVRLLLCST